MSDYQYVFGNEDNYIKWYTTYLISRDCDEENTELTVSPELIDKNLCRRDIIKQIIKHNLSKIYNEYPRLTYDLKDIINYMQGYGSEYDIPDDIHSLVIYKISLIKNKVVTLGSYDNIINNFFVPISIKYDKVKEENKLLKAEINELRLTLYYQPGGEGESECKEHFTSLCSQNHI